jgi:hypothetical protein
MNLFISHFKPWLLALGILVAFETTIWLTRNPHPLDRTNFLQFSFSTPETPQRLFMHHKFREFQYSNPTIVQSGDSSGFYGIEPAAVMRHLPTSHDYLNMSCCANLGFRGYYNTFKFMLENNSSVKYLALHFTPYTMPRRETWDEDGAALWGISDIKVFGHAVHREFLSVWRIFHLPSLEMRREITDWVYSVGWKLNQQDRPLLNNPNYAEFLRVFRQTKGWMKETDIRRNVPSTECVIDVPEFFDTRSMRWKSYLEEVLDAHAELARQYNAKLVVIFQPVACTVGTGVKNEKARKIVEEYKRTNLDVAIPFPLIETWPSELFSVPAHIKAEYTDLVGDRLGKALSEIIANDMTRDRPSM